MAKPTNKKTNLCTVGELIEALKTYDPTLPITVGSDHRATTYHLVPTKGESWHDKRGEVEICGDDPWQEDDED